MYLNRDRKQALNQLYFTLRIVSQRERALFPPILGRAAVGSDVANKILIRRAILVLGTCLDRTSLATDLDRNHVAHVELEV